MDATEIAPLLDYKQLFTLRNDITSYRAPSITDNKPLEATNATLSLHLPTFQLEATLHLTALADGRRQQIRGYSSCRWYSTLDLLSRWIVRLPRFHLYRLIELTRLPLLATSTRPEQKDS